MRAAPIVDDSVNFVDDERAHRRQHLPTGIRSQQQIKRLGRCDKNVRRFFDERLTLRGSRIAGANVRAHIDLAGHLFHPITREFRPAVLARFL